jgi:hypothetical protein
MSAGISLRTERVFGGAATPEVWSDVGDNYHGAAEPWGRTHLFVKSAERQGEDWTLPSTQYRSSETTRYADARPRTPQYLPSAHSSSTPPPANYGGGQDSQRDRPATPSRGGAGATQQQQQQTQSKPKRKSYTFETTYQAAFGRQDDFHLSESQKQREVLKVNF